jgi:hypothetical protein
VSKRNKKHTIEAQEGTPQCPTDPHDASEKFAAWRQHMEKIYQSHFGSHQAADYQHNLHVMEVREGEAKAGEGE